MTAELYSIPGMQNLVNIQKPVKAINPNIFKEKFI
jgi:hypothetical protein